MRADDRAGPTPRGAAAHRIPVVFLTAVALMSACATPYQPPPAGTPAASLTLSTTTYGGASFAKVDPAACPTLAEQPLAGFPLTLVGASMGESARRRSAPVSVHAGRPLHLVAAIGGTTCIWSAVFTPQAGASYEATLHATNNTCWLKVARADDGRQPPATEPGARYALLKSVRDMCR